MEESNILLWMGLELIWGLCRYKLRGDISSLLLVRTESTNIATGKTSRLDTGSPLIPVE